MIYFVANYTVKDIVSATLEECRDYLLSCSIIGIDTETTGLDPYSSDIIMLQVGDLERQYVIDCRRVDVQSLFPIIRDSRIKKLGANLAFDYKMMLHNWGVRMQGIQDIQITEKVLTTGKSKSSVSLKKLTEKYCNETLDKDERIEFTTIKNRRFNERQVRYGAKDIEVLFHIWKNQYQQLTDSNLHRCDYLEQKYVRVIGEMSYQGMPVNVNKWSALAVENTENMHKAEKDLTMWLYENKRFHLLHPPDLFSGEVTCAVNWGSPKQVAKLFESEGIPVKVIDEDLSKEYSEIMDDEIAIYKYETGKLELEKFKDNELVNRFLKFKKYQKAVTTYGTTWLERFINPVSGRVHTSFDQIKSTGRLGSYAPNVQQIPSFKSEGRLSCEAHRTCFEAPEGWKLVTRDFSGCESRILADYANEPAMIDFFLNDGGDLHSFTASKVFGVPVSKKENAHLRHIGKTLNFAIPYGAGGYKIGKQLKMTREEGDDIVNDFYDVFSNLDAYFEGCKTFIRNRGYTVLDQYVFRRAYFPYYEDYLKYEEQVDRLEERSSKEARSLMSKYMRLKGAMERMSQNYPIQATNASMTKISMSLLYDYLLENNLFDYVKIVLSLHDEIVLEVRDEYVDEIDAKLCEYMIYSGTLFCPKVPMKVDGGASQIWEH